MDPSFSHLTRDFLGGDPYLKSDEVAPLFRVDAKTVTRWALADRFPQLGDGRPTVIRTPGSQVRIRESVIRGLLDGTLQPREPSDG